jgi:GNAT superfamily N-acetyltransferase
MLVAEEDQPGAERAQPGRERGQSGGQRGPSGGALLGFVACGASRDPDAGPETGELQTFFVAAGSWRRGVGRGLMAAALADLTGRGCAEATVWSFAANARANDFYEAHGFRPDGAGRREEAWADILEVRYRRKLP